MAETKALLQSLSEEYQLLQQNLQSAVESRQKLESQRQENRGVQKEFDRLEQDEIIFKLVGPILPKQDKVEAESTVKGRLDFIGTEITRLEAQIKETQGNLEHKKARIIQIQAHNQEAAGGLNQATAQ